MSFGVWRCRLLRRHALHGTLAELGEQNSAGLWRLSQRGANSQSAAHVAVCMLMIIAYMCGMSGAPWHAHAA